MVWIGKGKGEAMKPGSSKNTPQQVARDAKGRFLKGTSGNPAGRQPGATCRALRLARDAAEEVALPALIEAARSGDLDACKALIAYGLPRQRPVSIPEPVDLPEEGGLSGQMAALLRLVARGEVSATAAGEVAALISTAAKVDEVTELREQVESLKRLLHSREVRKK